MEKGCTQHAVSFIPSKAGQVYPPLVGPPEADEPAYGMAG